MTLDLELLAHLPSLFGFNASLFGFQRCLLGLRAHLLSAYFHLLGLGDFGVPLLLKLKPLAVGPGAALHLLAHGYMMLAGELKLVSTVHHGLGLGAHLLCRSVEFLGSLLVAFGGPTMEGRIDLRGLSFQ